MRINNFLILGVFFVFLCLPLHLIFDLENQNKSNMTPEETLYAQATLLYFQGIISSYPDCKISKPREPKIVRVVTGHISEHCPEIAAACYIPTSNTIYYEEGNMNHFVHEYGHVILSNNKIPYDCFHELVLQQADILFEERHFRKKRVNNDGE